jgi:hypothetical protein
MNVLTGSLLLAFAALILAATSSLEKYSVADIGPGFFPGLCGLLLAAIGFTLIVSGLRTSAGERAVFDGRGAVSDALRASAITASVLAFALLLKPGGLALAAFSAAWIATRAGEVSHKTALVLSAALAIVLTLLFTVGLRLYMPALPAFLN